MKKLLFSFSMLCLANVVNAQCVDGYAYPEDPVAVSTCDGTTENIITDDSWSGEYAIVSLTAGRIYTFTTTEADYYITIATPSGTPLVYGKGPLVYSPTTNGEVYFYTHTSANCGSTWFDDHSKIVICSPPPTTAPSCTTYTLPSNGANPNDPVIINWAIASGATGYKLYIGTSTGNYNIANGISVTATSYTIPSPAPNTSYYVKIVPLNNIGEATGCSESSFVTGASDYCTSIPTNIGFNDGITNVTLNGETQNINNTTTTAAGSEYTNYSSTIGADLAKGKSYNLSVSVNTDGDYTQYQIAWIDWNQNKVFEDSERYDLGTATNVTSGLSSACPYSFTVPSSATLGDTRMRVRTFYYSGNVENPCMNGDDGEVEDYKISVVENLAVSDANKKGISIYPNPFTDVLKISDVKGVKDISVNDVSGREVKALVPSAELNLSSLKAGLYIVNLKMEDGSVKTFKAIKK
ncbi:MAG: T9SS type A sorting domain-containing protein [Chryseobacterium sp.]|nr:T9SS type A sorting domain-containing protein [Chryseobacterium sp.]